VPAVNRLSTAMRLSQPTPRRSESWWSLWRGIDRQAQPALHDFLAALRTSGLSAPLVVDGAINGAVFRAYVEQQLAPTLRAGEIVIMDNLNSHKVAGVGEAIEARGAMLAYLPPYSPDFNPIELVFAKFKWLLRSNAARTKETLGNLCGELLDRFPPSECANYFRHCGYPLHRSMKRSSWQTRSRRLRMLMGLFYGSPDFRNDNCAGTSPVRAPQAGEFC
jgi:transposase